MRLDRSLMMQELSIKITSQVASAQWTYQDHDKWPRHAFGASSIFPSGFCYMDIAIQELIIYRCLWFDFNYPYLPTDIPLRMASRRHGTDGPW
jgi:hypothetical protein